MKRIPAEVVEAVKARSRGRCEAAATPDCVGVGQHVHHRAGRGPGRDRPDLLLHLCHVCHAYAHAHPTEAYAAGWLLSRHGTPPATAVGSPSMTPTRPICQTCAVHEARFVRVPADPTRPADPVSVCVGCKASTERLRRGAYTFLPITMTDADTEAPVVEAPAEQGTLADAPIDATGGRVANYHPDTARQAARTTNAGRQREDVHARLVLAGARGRIADELAKSTGVPPNQIASRLQELWERRRAAVARERGFCAFGECRPHAPSAPHYPQDKCARHGDVVKRTTSRGRGAAVWCAL